MQSRRKTNGSTIHKLGALPATAEARKFMET
jgi:hypothetical protein